MRFAIVVLALAFVSSPSHSQSGSSSASDGLYNVIMATVRTQVIKGGKADGQMLRDVYKNGAAPKAIAICVDWNTTTPRQLNGGQGGKWRYILGDGGCKPKNEDEARQCALDDCVAYANCPGKQTCAVVDVNGKNALSIPDNWLKRHGK